MMTLATLRSLGQASHKSSRFIQYVCVQQRPFSVSCQRCAFNTAQKKQYGKKDYGQYILMVIPVTAFCLGTWQVKRRKWKLDLIEKLQSRTNAPIIDLPNDLSELESLEYQRVRIRGTFDHSHELYVLPRSLIQPDDNRSHLMSGSGPGPGVHVVTPFHLSDRNMTIMINRGWVPRKKSNPANRTAGQIEGELELVGVVRKTENRQQFGAANVPERNQWFHRDIEAMSNVLHTEPIFLDADKSSTVRGGPIGGQTRVSLRNEHFSYILTWYTLSAVTSIMWYQRYWK